MSQTPKRNAVAVFAIQSFSDPLFKGLMYQYLKQYNKENEPIDFHIFTEEHPEYALEENAQKQLQQDLVQEGIYWHPLRYRRGRFLILKKIWSILVFFFALWRTKRRHNIKVLLGSLVIASGYCYIVSRILRMKLIAFNFEPHSDYMIDFKTWTKSSLKYKLLNKIERRQALYADYITGPTQHTVELIKSWKSTAKIYRLPICIDVNKFVFQPESRTALRQKYNLDDRYVLLYLGKFNGIYYSPQEVAHFLKQLRDFDASIFVFTITPEDTNAICQAYLQAGLSDKDFMVLNKIPYDQIDGYISACDMGLLAVPPLESQKYRGPVKTGNYLACGLPFIVNKGVADDDWLAETEQVGVVLDSLEEDAVHKALPSLRAMMDEPREAQRQRCRQAAIKHRGIQNSVAVFKDIFEDVFKL